MMRDLNRYIGVRVRVDITGVFGVPCESDNEKRVVDCSAEKGLVVCIMHFKQMNRVIRDQMEYT